MRVNWYYLRISRNCSIVLLVKLKDAPGVVDGDSVMLNLCGAFRKTGHWNQLSVAKETKMWK